MDYIIHLCCPSSVQDTFSGRLFQRDALTNFLNEIRYWGQYEIMNEVHWQSPSARLNQGFRPTDLYYNAYALISI